MKRNQNLLKKVLLHPVSILIAGLIVGLVIGNSLHFTTNGKMKTLFSGKDTTYAYRCPLSDWEVMVLAIAKTESDFNFLARGSKNDLGLLQATEIWVKDVNRIIGEQRYLHCDALDPVKTLEMFSIIQNHYNPDKEVTRAIHLHNPGGDAIGYSVKVRKNIEWVKRYETIRQLVHTH